MIQRSTWLHLRLPFSFFLMPVFVFSIAVANAEPSFSWWKAALAFIAWHVFVYPASNGYNSYFDKDEESIGGLEKPPPVQKELYYAALIADALGLLAGLPLGGWFIAGLFLYGMVSKAYSHPWVRLKKRPFAGWLTVGIFQGAWVWLFSWQAVTGAPLSRLAETGVWLPALLSSTLLLASYPMTQVYQHNEDSRRGDRTISLMLGIRGTFLFTAAVFALAGGALAWYFFMFHSVEVAVGFLVAQPPVLGWFFYWMWRVWQNPARADFRATMRLNLLSALSLNLFFLWMLLRS